MITIDRANLAEAAPILALQKVAYQSEARLYGDFRIPPLTQTLEQLLEEMPRKVVLAARDGATLIGSARGFVREHTGVIERLIVHPDWQGRGIGTRLLVAIEAALRPVRRFELFTGHRSERNLALYERLGYVRFKRERITPSLEFVYLEKLAA